MGPSCGTWPRLLSDRLLKENLEKTKEKCKVMISIMIAFGSCKIGRSPWRTYEMSVEACCDSDMLRRPSILNQLVLFDWSIDCLRNIVFMPLDSPANEFVSWKFVLNPFIRWKAFLGMPLSKRTWEKSGVQKESMNTQYAHGTFPLLWGKQIHGKILSRCNYLMITSVNSM